MIKWPWSFKQYSFSWIKLIFDYSAMEAIVDFLYLGLRHYYFNVICCSFLWTNVKIQIFCFMIYTDWESPLVQTETTYFFQIKFWKLRFVCIQTDDYQRFLFRTKTCKQNHLIKDFFSHCPGITRRVKTTRERWSHSTLKTLSG